MLTAKVARTRSARASNAGEVHRSHVPAALVEAGRAAIARADLGVTARAGATVTATVRATATATAGAEVAAGRTAKVVMGVTHVHSRSMPRKESGNQSDLPNWVRCKRSCFTRVARASLNL